ncbi:hypothetical protein [Butyrivibrio sp. AE2015]|uniref:hypothetical protein n=1 Tax=Butyrivibrio sp. AE2015 TaxID=1280663 RepID=UPI0003B48B8B|nr:hypothetical protein [Butyrivibrio sp. AE2015]
MRLIKGISKKIFSIILCMVIAVFIAFLLICTSYILPIDRIEKNVASSARYIQKEGSYPGLAWWTTQLDNVTDSAMLLVAANDTEESLIVEAMSSHLGGINDADLAVTIVKHYIDGQEFDRIGSYSRYWHGYVVVLRPLLMLTDYLGIRIINGIIQLFLIYYICRLLFLKGRKEYISSILVSYGMLMPLALALSLQFSPCFYIATIASIFILIIGTEKIDRYGYLIFLIIGAMTSFFDFLTYPIVTLGVPMLFYFAIKDSSCGIKHVRIVVEDSICWGVGYIGMWSSKWIFATAITEKNVIKDAADTFLYRTSQYQSQSIEISRISCELRNYGAFFKTPVTMVLVVIVVYLLINIIRACDNNIIGILKIMFPYFMIAMMPFAWYAFALQHSYAHFWFTNKACVVSIMAIMFGLHDVLRSITNVKEQE